MRIADIVSDAIKEINAQTKEIKQGDDDDLASLADKFDSIAGLADSVAGKLHTADQALGNEQEVEQDDTTSDEEGQEEGDEAEQSEQ